MWTITFHCVYPAYCETLHIATTTLAITVTSHGRRGVSNHQPLDCLSDSLFSSHQMKHQRSASMARCVRGSHWNRSHAMTLQWVYLTYTITHCTSGVTDVKSDKILPRFLLDSIFMFSANERRRYNVTSSLICWDHAVVVWNYQFLVESCDPFTHILQVCFTDTGAIVCLESPSGRDIFCLQKLWHFHKNSRSGVENECRCPRTVNISNVNFTLKIPIFYRLASLTLGQSYDCPSVSEASLKNMGKLDRYKITQHNKERTVYASLYAPNWT